MEPKWVSDSVPEWVWGSVERYAVEDAVAIAGRDVDGIVRATDCCSTLLKWWSASIGELNWWESFFSAFDLHAPPKYMEKMCNSNHNVVLDAVYYRYS